MSHLHGIVYHFLQARSKFKQTLNLKKKLQHTHANI